jgi:hypothetical protein
MIIFGVIDWPIPLFVVLIACMAVVWLWAIISCVCRKDFSRTEKVAWVLVLLFTNCVGLIAYFVFGSSRRRMRAGRYPKALDPVTGMPESK